MQAQPHHRNTRAHTQPTHTHIHMYFNQKTACLGHDHHQDWLPPVWVKLKPWRSAHKQIRQLKQRSCTAMFDTPTLQIFYMHPLFRVLPVASRAARQVNNSLPSEENTPTWEVWESLHVNKACDTDWRKQAEKLVIQILSPLWAPLRTASSAPPLPHTRHTIEPLYTHCIQMGSCLVRRLLQFVYSLEESWECNPCGIVSYVFSLCWDASPQKQLDHMKPFDGPLRESHSAVGTKKSLMMLLYDSIL